MNNFEYYLDFFSMPALFVALVGLYPVEFSSILVGIVLWSLTEYLIHRYAFHMVSWLKSPHDNHHRKPSGKTGVTSLQSFVLFVILWAVMPAQILAGFVLGYCAYIVMHHAFHHWTIGTKNILYSTKMRHTMHHRGVEANFGLTTPVWDHVFRTYSPW